MSKANKARLIRILSHYDLGIIQQVARLQAGRAHSRKILVTSARGRTILKYRRTTQEGVERIEFAHSVLAYLKKRGLEVCVPIPSRDQGKTVVYLGGVAYEMLPYIAGQRYPQTLSATADAGLHLGQLHRSLGYFRASSRLSTLSYHDSPAIRRHLKTSLPERLLMSSGMKDLLEDLRFAYDDSTARVNRLGCEQWASQIIHGDWHPGNLIYHDDRVVAILDFDTIRMALPVLDLANGLLQFSIQTGSAHPHQWPAALDMHRLTQFLAGYRQAHEPTAHELQAIPDLMIESLMAEAVIPIAASGSLGPYAGSDFLAMIQRKIDWIRNHRRDLIARLVQVCDQAIPAQLPQAEPGQAQGGQGA